MDSFCQICSGGAKFKGFAIPRGTRQGGPLSSLLLAAATDLMLRRLRRRFPDACTRAWADDLAMVVQQGGDKLKAMQDFFNEFYSVSGLQLNIGKTVCVPLFQYIEGEVRDLISRQAPDWGGVLIAPAAKYLGFYVGPGRGHKLWNTPLQKYSEKTKQWESWDWACC